MAPPSRAPVVPSRLGSGCCAGGETAGVEPEGVISDPALSVSDARQCPRQACQAPVTPGTSPVTATAGAAEGEEGEAGTPGFYGPGAPPADEP